MTTIENTMTGDILRAGVATIGGTDGATTPLALFTSARGFAAAADATVLAFGHDGHLDQLDETVCFLLAQAIELLFKVLLRMHSWSDHDLRDPKKVSHDLTKAATEAQLAGFPALCAEDGRILGLLNATYAKSKMLQYRPALGIVTPSIKAVRELVRELMITVAAEVLDPVRVRLCEQNPVPEGFQILAGADYAGPSLADLRRRSLKY
jgi:hypothetical protein